MMMERNRLKLISDKIIISVLFLLFYHLVGHHALSRLQFVFKSVGNDVFHAVQLPSQLSELLIVFGNQVLVPLVVMGQGVLLALHLIQLV
jgi:hypothetical protein